MIITKNNVEELVSKLESNNPHVKLKIDEDDNTADISIGFRCWMHINFENDSFIIEHLDSKYQNWCYDFEDWSKATTIEELANDLIILLDEIDADDEDEDEDC